MIWIQACHDQQAAVILLSLLSLALDSEAKLSQQDDPYFCFFYRYSVAWYTPPKCSARLHSFFFSFFTFTCFAAQLQKENSKMK